MEKSFSSHVCVVSLSLINKLIEENDRWAEAVLSQGFAMPANYRDALLNKDAPWQIKNKNTITIFLTD